jgi:hypothetical protein
MSFVQNLEPQLDDLKYLKRLNHIMLTLKDVVATDTIGS